MEQIATADGQVVMQTVSPQQVQVMQMNATGQVIQGANGQQIMVHAVPQGGQMQVTQGAQGIQQIQVVPVSSLQGAAQGQILLQQPQQAQIVQTADGQTFIYQPVAIDNTSLQAQPTGKPITIFLLYGNEQKIITGVFNFSIKYKWQFSTTCKSTCSKPNSNTVTYYSCSSICFISNT